MQEEKSLNEIFSLRLSRAIDEKSLTQRELSLMTNIAQSAISKYLSGKGLPRTTELYKLSKVLGVSMDYLCGLRHNPPINNSLYEENISLKSTLQFAVGTLEGALGTLKKQVPTSLTSPLAIENDKYKVAEDTPSYGK